MQAIQLGYIHSPRADFICFIALPFVAIAIALFFHTSLPYVAEASVAYWITVPHHYAGWVRGYGLGEDWSRWRDRLVFGPLLLITAVLMGTALVPITLALVLMLWDHQHSLMQQHGFSRVYDFKAGSGAPSTGRFDLWLSIFLYGNMLVTAPLWSELWIGELYRWDLALRVDQILSFQHYSWILTGIYVAVYLVHLVVSRARGYALNPMKYLFVFASYALWYYVSWRDSFLVYLVAHRITHGVQYMAMVYWYVDNKALRTGQFPRLLSQLSVLRFLLLGVAYTVIFHVVTGAPLSLAGFGLIDALQSDEFLKFSGEKATGFYAATAISAAGACHYYLDSYIWKVRDPQTQEGL